MGDPLLRGGLLAGASRAAAGLPEDGRHRRAEARLPDEEAKVAAPDDEDEVRDERDDDDEGAGEGLR